MLSGRPAMHCYGNIIYESCNMALIERKINKKITMLRNNSILI